MAIGDDAIDDFVLLAQVNRYGVIVLVDCITAVLVHGLIDLAVNHRVALDLEGTIHLIITPSGISLVILLKMIILDSVRPLDTLTNKRNVLVFLSHCLNHA